MPSIKKRFVFSVGANIARAAISLIVGLLVARGLGPADYGNLAYLLGSFWAIRALLDMGMSSAFYTFIAQRDRSRRYYLVYFGWLAFQFVFSLTLVALLLPPSVVEHFWLGQERELILLALFANFLQNQVWQTVVQIHEAGRKTIRLQIVSLSIIVAHLLLIVAMLFGQWLNVQAVLWAIVFEYILATAWLSSSLRVQEEKSLRPFINVDEESIKSVVSVYVKYCRPMVVIAIFSFCYEMVDRWLLQRFGGASQQGFYQIASQLSTISLLATSSILNIFWKEIAEANARNEYDRVAKLYLKTTQMLVFLASFVSCFLVPWAEQLVDVLLGSAYHDAWPVLLLMLFYPIHQAVGQINGTLFMATGRNTAYMKITVVGLLASIPFSFALMAPQTGDWLSGLELGAMGLSIKIVGLNILFVSIQSFMIARHYGINTQWDRQVFVIVSLLVIGYGCRLTVGQLLSVINLQIDKSMGLDVLAEFMGSGAVYLGCVLALLMQMPELIGMDKVEMAALKKRLSIFLYRGNA